MKSLFRKEVYSLNKKELKKKEYMEFILKIAEELLNKEDGNVIPIRSYINMIGFSVLEKEFLNLISSEEVCTADAMLHDAGVDVDFKIRLDKAIILEDEEAKKKFPISLANDLVIPLAWNTSRFINCIVSIGKDEENPFSYVESNHISFLILPLGITLVVNGNHSILTGIMKKEGIIYPNEIFDLSHLYDANIKFDGTAYRKDNEILYEVLNVELGILFEIGRLLKQKNIDFLNDEQKEYLNKYIRKTDM